MKGPSCGTEWLASGSNPGGIAAPSITSPPWRSVFSTRRVCCPHQRGHARSCELRELRSVSASMGLMLESGAQRLCQRGGPHLARPTRTLSPVADPRAGRALRVPMTTGLLVGIGETREERLRDLEHIGRLHERYGHIQEVIIQNFCAKPGTLMAEADHASLEELLWTVVQARLLLPPDISIQAPPNLSPGQLGQLIDAALTIGVASSGNAGLCEPEAPWPSLNALRAATQAKGKHLVPRLTVYPKYLQSLSGSIRGCGGRCWSMRTPKAWSGMMTGARVYRLHCPFLRRRRQPGRHRYCRHTRACLREEAIDEAATLALFSARDADVEAMSGGGPTAPEPGG